MPRLYSVVEVESVVADAGDAVVVATEVAFDVHLSYDSNQQFPVAPVVRKMNTPSFCLVDVDVDVDDDGDHHGLQKSPKVAVVDNDTGLLVASAIIPHAVTAFSTPR